MKMRAFSLIELLVCVVIFSIIATIALSLVSAASKISSKAKLRVGVREDVRMVFDRMALDFSAMVRFDNYQFQITNGSNATLSLLIQAAEDHGSRLQRVDYIVEGAGLFRSVQGVNWDAPQDLTVIPQGSKELLSSAVGSMQASVVRDDNSWSRVEDRPAAREDQRPIGLAVSLAVMDPTERSVRSLNSPTVITNATNPSVSLPSAEVVRGWKIFEKTFRLP